MQIFYERRDHDNVADYPLSTENILNDQMRQLTVKCTIEEKNDFFQIYTYWFASVMFLLYVISIEFAMIRAI